MKYFIIFLLCFFVVAAFFLGPDKVGIKAGITDNFIDSLEMFSEFATIAKDDITFMQDLSNDLENLTLNYESVPDTFEEEGTLKGLMQVLKSIGLTIAVPFQVILHLFEILIHIIVNVVLLLYTIIQFFNIFTITPA